LHKKNIAFSFASADLTSYQKLLNYMISFHPNRSIWKERSYKNRYCFKKCSLNSEKAITLCDRDQPVDYILQFQTMFSPFYHLENLSIPYGIYTDYTIAMAKKEYPDWLPFSLKGSEWWYRQEKKIFRQAKHIFTFSNPVKQSIIEDYSIAPEKIFPVRAGGSFIDIKISAETGRKEVNNFLFVGKDYKRKGVEYLLEAFLTLLKSYNDVQLTVIGCTIPDKYNNVSNIPFIKDRLELIKYFKESDVFIMPSLAEPFGYTYLEAMGCGKPCIGTAVGGVTDIIIDGKTGFVVPPRNSDALAEKMRWFIENPQKAVEFGKASYEHFNKSFKWEDIVDDILSIIHSG